ncbi:MAG TPA: Flp family type IVb pilin [Oscillatoriaceae cyanobacterium]
MWYRLLVDEDGQSLVEYGLIVGLVSVALTATLIATKEKLVNIFNTTGQKMQQAAQTAQSQ